MRKQKSEQKKHSSASVKVMLSYDYCHFEVVLGCDREISTSEVDAMRKDAQRLADKAVEQYRVAKAEESRLRRADAIMLDLSTKVKAIKENIPKSEWDAEQKATVKAYEDAEFRVTQLYDYQDDWDV